MTTYKGPQAALPKQSAEMGIAYNDDNKVPITANLTTADVVVLMDIPAGTKLTGLKYRAGDLDSAATLAVNLGYRSTGPDQQMAAAPTYFLAASAAFQAAQNGWVDLTFEPILFTEPAQIVLVPTVAGTGLPAATSIWAITEGLTRRRLTHRSAIERGASAPRSFLNSRKDTAMGATVQVEYVGSKPFKVDNVAGTGIVWNGAGDVQPVPGEAWVKLAVHTGIWQEVSAEPRRTSPVQAPPQVPLAAPISLAQATAPAVAADQAATGDANPSDFVLICDEQVQLATITAAAKEASGLSDEAWAELDPGDVDDFVEQQIEAMRTAAADAKVKAAAAAKADEKPETVPPTYAEMKAAVKEAGIAFKGNPSKEAMAELYEQALAKKG